MKIAPAKYIPDDTGHYVIAALNGTILTFDKYPDQEFDLADLQGSKAKRLRFTIDHKGNISINAAEDYWLIAELDLPAKTYTSETVLNPSGEPVIDKNGQQKTTSIVDAIYGRNLKLTAWRFPRSQKVIGIEN